jgi:trehalose-phosphatase
MDYLFDKWDKLKKTLINKCIFLFLDYDGTLTPIVATSDKAILSKETKGVLKKLSTSRKYKSAIISGRSLKDIKNMVSLRDIIYIGNHGLEIEGPKIKFESPVSPRIKSVIKYIKEELSRRLSMIKGTFVEDKDLSLSIHYRLAKEKDILLIKKIFDEVTHFFSVRGKIKISLGKKVFEVKPPLEWDKGKVVLWLLARQEFILKNKEIFPVYMGDDITDEDAFKVLRNKGLTIFVGRPKKSYAEYFLKDTKEVIRFLKNLNDLNQKR